ncbi:hypothetical protein GIB67_031459 [Kingdonia uniflora]|uniref:Retrotransposon Copia-like N-terminal domain-containing protein n=1 Tax=Kingdonia uniflora TaxID=39325 RepID=A0A7J7MB75_9MAGN|nr:hypothetical protein GIB67_031459 [Kingdonia uniflora]
MVSSSSTSSASSSSLNPFPPLQTTTIHHLISEKLDTDNYLLWLTQFTPLLKGYDLEGYVDGTIPCPPRTLSTTDSTIDPAYLQWQKQDQILLGWLLSSLSRIALTHVVGLSTSRAVWDALQKHYASKSRARIMQLRRELQTMRKGSKPMKDYFLHAKELADSLAASGHPMSDPDLQQIILSGLDNAYDAIVTTLAATMADISMDDFYAHLIAFDMHLEAQTVMLRQHPVATQQRNMSFKPGFNQNRNRSYSGNQYRNRGQGMNRFTNRSQSVQSVVGPCLICGQKNHTAQTCWHRSDQMSQAAPSPPTA